MCTGIARLKPVPCAAVKKFGKYKRTTTSTSTSTLTSASMLTLKSGEKGDQDQNRLRSEIQIPQTIVLAAKEINNATTLRKSLWELYNPGYNVTVFNDKDCQAFIHSEYGENEAKQFAYIRDGPIKADLFRVLYLYRRGGWWADVDLIPLTPLATIMGSNDDHDGSAVIPKSRFSYQLNPTLIGAKAGDDSIGAAVSVYRSLWAEGHPKKYGYWNWSIVHILSALYLAGHPFDLGTVKEICPSYFDHRSCFIASADGQPVAILHSGDYDSKHHGFASDMDE